MKTYIHPKGAHGSEPFTPKPWVKKVSGSFYFTSKSQYILTGIDQYDWNKLAGISWNILKPNQNATMLAWRFLNGKFQVCAYININGNNVPYESPKQIVEFGVGEVGEFSIDRWGINFRNTDKTTYWTQIPIPTGVVGSWLTSFRIQPWFGGNNPAPNNIELKLEFQ